MKHIIRPAAKDDVLRQYRYYLLEGALDAAAHFVDAVDDTVQVVCRMPHMGAPKNFRNPVLTGLRSWPVKDFEDILIFYLVQRDTVRIVRVLHGRRDIKRILEQEQ